MTFKLLSKEDAAKTVDQVSTHVKLMGPKAKLLKRAATEKNLSLSDTVEQMVDYCLKELFGADALK